MNKNISSNVNSINEKNNKGKIYNSKPIDIKSDKSHYYKEIFPILPLIILIFFLPFIIRLKLISLEGVFYDKWTGQKISTDFFTYYKQIFIYLITVWSLIHTFFFTKKINQTKAYYFLGAYAVLVILSTIFSEFPQISLYGFVERKEGMWIVLCYILLMISAINLVKTKFQVDMLLYALGISGAIISLIAIFQYIGFDIFELNSVREFIVTRDILQKAEAFNITLGEKYAYSVFYNPNYLGGYLSFYGPLMMGMVLYNKANIQRLMFFVFFILSGVALFASRSEAGALGFIVGLSIIIAGYVIRNFSNKTNSTVSKHKIILTVMLVVSSIIVLPLLISFVPVEGNPLERIRRESVQMSNSNDEETDYKTAGPITDIRRVNDSAIEVVADNIPLTISTSGTHLILTTKNNVLYHTSLSEIPDGKNIRIENLLNHETYILLNKTENPELYGLRLYLRDFKTVLYFKAVGNRLDVADAQYRPLDIEEDFAVAPHIGFEGKGGLGSARGYIWSRSLPIAFDNVLVGTGQDTFITKFPQFDIYGKQAEIGLYGMWTRTDKPHSLYIQIAIHSGLLSIVILLSGFVLLTVKSFRLMADKGSSGFIINASLIGFMISSLFNDSILAITPIIYIFAGVNIVCILISKSEKAVQE